MPLVLKGSKSFKPFFFMLSEKGRMNHDGNMFIYTRWFETFPTLMRWDIHCLMYGLWVSICRDELVISSGSEAGALLVDGLGDGVFLEAADQEFEFLRTTAFGMLQGCRMRNTKTVCGALFFFFYLF
jgi:hypothetical protein